MNYARNEDQLCRGSNTTPAYSSIIFIAFLAEGAELITLAEAKAYLRIDASETTFDAQVTMAIAAARMAVENYLNMSLISRTITATMNIANGVARLPYGPIVGAVTSVIDSSGSAIDTGNYQQNSDAVYSMWYSQATFTYNAGYTTLPPAFKLGILKLLAFDWQHTGDDGTARSIGVITGLKMYRRVA